MGEWTCRGTYPCVVSAVQVLSHERMCSKSIVQPPAVRWKTLMCTQRPVPRTTFSAASDAISIANAVVLAIAVAAAVAIAAGLAGALPPVPPGLRPRHHQHPSWLVAILQGRKPIQTGPLP